MNLSFYNSLTENQKNYADRVAKAAQRIGVPEDLAVAIAFRESSLNPAVKTGTAGEIGIMQIKPSTAKELGYELEDLRDPNKNIDAGLAYLKKNLEMSGGDKRLAAAGYNAGPYHEFFTKETGKLPESTVKYLNDLKGYGAFETPIVELRQAETSTNFRDELSPEGRKILEDVEQEQAETLSGMIGGGAGLALSGARAVVPLAQTSAALANRVAGPVVRQVAQAAMGRPTAPAQPPIGGTMAPALADDAAQISRILQGTTDVDTGTTGRARMGGFNFETAQQSARAKQAGETLGALQRAGLVSESPQSLMAKAPGMTSTPSGILTPRSAPSATIPTATPPSKGALEAVSDMFKKMMGPGTIPRAAIRYVAPPLAGLQIGQDIGTIITEKERAAPDYTKMGLSGLSALGGALSLFPATAPIGIPLAIGAPLAQAYREKTEGALPVTTDVVAP